MASSNTEPSNTTPAIKQNEQAQGQAGDKQQLDKVEATVRQSLGRHLSSSPNSNPPMILVGLSGGCDSVGLLHALHSQTKNKDIRLHAVHFDHEQRGDESTRDRIFCQELCTDLGVQLHVYKWSSGDGVIFSQEAARTWRQVSMYKLLGSLILDDARGIICTAHHADDSMESMLLKLIRGVHLTNISGMQEAIEFDEMPKALFLRPLLRLHKKDILTYLQAQDLSWREDASNLTNKYKRNRVRNDLIPLLSELVGSDVLLAKRLGQLEQQSRFVKVDLEQRVQECLAEQHGEYFTLQIVGAPSLLVQQQALYEWIQRWHPSLPYDQLLRIQSQLADYPESRQWTLHVGQGWNIRRTGDCLEMLHGDASVVESIPMRRQLHAVAMTDDDMAPIDSSELLIRVDDTDNIFVLTTASEIKTWRFQPPWSKSQVKLKDFLRGQGVPLHLRNDCCCVVTADLVVAVKIDDEWIVSGKYAVIDRNASQKKCPGRKVKICLP